MFKLSQQPIDPKTLINHIRRQDAGALVTFEGWVRDVNDGKKVAELTYEVYEDLALSEGAKIIEDAKNRFEILDAVCCHRYGVLKPSEIAVFVGVVSTHRQVAFAACKYIIDEIKHRLPIWKKEVFADGKYNWVHCNHLDLDESALYKQQINLKEVGLVGQAKLKAAKVAVVGAGGLGSSALQYLASAGVGELAVIEADLLESSNLHRQVIYKVKDLGLAKAQLAKTALEELNPLIKIVTFKEYLNAHNIDAILRGYNLVLDCTDNFTSKFLLNDYCLSHDITLVHSSIYQFEGQLQIVGRNKQGERIGQCLRCLYPSPPHEISACANASGLIASCGQSGVIGATAGALGSLQALEALKVILGMESPLNNHVVYVDLTTLETRKIKTTQSSGCSACSGRSLISPGNILNRGFAALPPLETFLNDFSKEELGRYTVVDIREHYEPSIKNFPIEPERWPLSTFDQWPQLNPDKNYLLVCAHGVRSLAVAKRLYALGNKNVCSLSGGFALFLAKKQPLVNL